MKRNTLFVCLLLAGNYLFAQKPATCGFERLFAVHPGEDKRTITDEMKQAYHATQLSITANNIKPDYIASEKDSILIETITYHIDSSACFQGHTQTLRLSFADNKLFKAYISAEFSKDQFDEMEDNLNALRKTIQNTYPHERAIKIKGTDVSGFGYTYTKDKRSKLKPDVVNAQYVLQNLPGTPRQFYLLEFTWSNLNNTRMQGSNY